MCLIALTFPTHVLLPCFCYRNSKTIYIYIYIYIYIVTIRTRRKFEYTTVDCKLPQYLHVKSGRFDSKNIPAFTSSFSQLFSDISLLNNFRWSSRLFDFTGFWHVLFPCFVLNCCNRHYAYQQKVRRQKFCH